MHALPIAQDFLPIRKDYKPLTWTNPRWGTGTTVAGFKEELLSAILCLRVA
jgi:hypothetical protein